MNTLQSISAAPTTKRKLTAEELATYHENGYVEVPNLFPLEELEVISREIDRIRAQPDEHQLKHSIRQLGLRSEITRQVCEDDRILTLIEDLVFPGIAIYSAKMVEKHPFDKSVCHWHQDDAYYSQKSESSCRMSVWIPLQDCDEKNGCVWMVPGSHKKGLLEFQHRKTGTCNLAFAEGTENIPGAIPCHIKAGSILLFHALTWHRSLGNSTSSHRRSFIISYQDALALQGNGEQHKILRPAA